LPFYSNDYFFEEEEMLESVSFVPKGAINSLLETSWLLEIASVVFVVVFFSGLKLVGKED